MRMIYPGEDRTQRKEKLQAKAQGKKKKKYEAFENFKWWRGPKIFTLEEKDTVHNYSHKISCLTVNSSYNPFLKDVVNEEFQITY